MQSVFGLLKSHRLSNKQAVLCKLLTNCSQLPDLLTVVLILINLINTLNADNIIYLHKIYVMYIFFFSLMPPVL